jgi:hypothetical protein
MYLLRRCARDKVLPAADIGGERELAGSEACGLDLLQIDLAMNPVTPVELTRTSVDF